jgi:thiamine phosphate synthase YjbQ (UPF0047 family)
MQLGTWQAIYAWEHRRGAQTREMIMTILRQ